ncbi:BatA and WFA domain-containing protein [Flavobacterium sp.]|uniref:vWA domain-containing protein n=1 Tax=Flavobacterium sp. TaxID=239 RepID=UPI0025E3724C|nr:BatA and WFA domain-containing protein [Flavobacterium sp.]
MQFKHPEILYFLFLLAVPILVHLFQLRRFKTAYFTNVRFLKALTIQSRKSSQIKKWLLLATRLLLLTALVLAFAQPFLATKEKSNSQKELYIILDNSYSMQAKGKKGELLQRAIQELLETTPETIHFSLLTNTEAFWNTDIKSIQKELQNLQYSATPFELDPILNQIQAHPSLYQKEIVVISDAIGLESKQLTTIAKTDAISFIIPKAEQQNNVSIDSVFIRQTLDNFYEIGIQVSNYGENNQPISMGLYNQNKLVAKTMVSLKKQKQVIPFTIPKKAFHGSVSLVDNGLTFDNTYYFSIGESQKTKVISIGEVAKSSFLSRIYTNDEFEYQNSTLAQLDYNLIENQDAIVLNEVEEIPQALQTTLHSFVEKGGNLILIPSAKSSISNLNSLVQKTGNTVFKSANTTEKLITKIHFNHPIFRNVFENQISNFQYPKTKTSFTITSTSPAVLSYQDESPFLVSSNTGAGNVSIFSAALNMENSNFQQSPLIVPVLYQLSQSQEKNGVTARTIGNTDSYFVTTNLDKEGVLTVKNETEQFIPMQQILNAKVKMEFGEHPKQAGNFAVFNTKKWIQNISFNYNRSESDLFQNNEKLLSNTNQIDSMATVFERIQSENNDSQIWKWFLIFALLLLVTEMAIIRFMK